MWANAWDWGLGLARTKPQRIAHSPRFSHHAMHNWHFQAVFACTFASYNVTWGNPSSHYNDEFLSKICPLARNLFLVAWLYHFLASSPGPSQILSRNHGCEIKSGRGLGTRLIISMLHDYIISMLHDYIISMLHDYIISMLHDYIISMLHDYTISMLHDYYHFNVAWLLSFPCCMTISFSCCMK